MERARKQYNVQLEDEVIERIDRLAASLDLPRSQVIRNLIMVGLDDAEVLNKTGVLKVISVAKEVRRKFVEDIVGGKLSLDKKGEWKVGK